MSIPLGLEPSQKILRELFDYDAKHGHLIRRVSYKNVDAGASTADISPAWNGYVRVRAKSRKYALHRLVWVWHNGKIPPGVEIDHKNGIRSDCRIEKLRISTHIQNCQNVAKKNLCSSKYVGVYLTPNSTWRVRIRVNTKRYGIGSFATEEQAYAARVAAEKKYHKEFAAHKRLAVHPS